MGGFEKERNFLCALFAACFSARLPPGTEFDMCLVDLMQFLYPLVNDKNHPIFDGRRVAERLEQITLHYMNREDDAERPLVTGTSVFMMDTPHCVPKNKAATQRSRDGDSGGGQHMDEALYQRLVEARDGDTESLFIDDAQRDTTTCALPGPAVWRSPNLRFQLCRLVTHKLLHLTPVEGRVLIIDDGVAFSTERFDALRALILEEQGWSQRPAFERECLLHQFLIEKQRYHGRLILYPDGQFKRCHQTGTGEADIKIQHYLRPHNGARRYLVVNQDTDVLFILLLHMPTFLAAFTEEERRHVEVYIDCRSPSDKTADRPYRYINVKALYYAWLDLSAREFPTVQCPLETFVLLVVSIKTDYTRKFAGCLAIGSKQVWETFAALHTAPSVAGGFLMFTDDPTPLRLERSRTASRVASYPPTLRGLLDRAVQYDAATEQFQLDHRAIARFYYYLCQPPLMRARSALSLPGNDVLRAIEPVELLAYAKEVQERLEAYAALVDEREQTATLLLEHKRKADTPAETEDERAVARRKLEVPGRHQPVTRTRVAVDGDEAIDASSDEEVTPQQMFDNPCKPSRLAPRDMKTYLAQNEQALATLHKKKLPPLYGLPNQREMNARISRIAWYLRYCRHGWQSRTTAQDCATRSEIDPACALWGWRETEVTATTANTTLCEARMGDDGRLHYYAVEECDEVAVATSTINHL